MNGRHITSVNGADAAAFLQGLLTNDILPLTQGEGLVYTALLTPQGKYLADFFVGYMGGQLFLDLPDMVASMVMQRLNMYKLRADVQFAVLNWAVGRGLGAAPAGALADPRHAALGWRCYGVSPASDAQVNWDDLRVRHIIPETGVELVQNDSFILEMGFERLNGVNFKKGCYVGQEVTARMKHKTDLRKGLVRLEIDGQAPVGSVILTDEGKEAGTLFTQSNGHALAHLRFDRAQGGLATQGARLQWDGVSGAL